MLRFSAKARRPTCPGCIAHVHTLRVLLETPNSGRQSLVPLRRLYASIGDPIQPGEAIILRSEVVPVVKAALDSRHDVPDIEKSALLQHVQSRVNHYAKGNSKAKRAFRRRVQRALAEDNPLTAIRDAVPALCHRSAQADFESIDADDAATWSALFVATSRKCQDGEVVEVLKDIDYVTKHAPLPSAKDYPYLPPGLHKAGPELKSNLVRQYLQTTLEGQFKVKEVFRDRIGLPLPIREKMPANVWGCALRIRMSEANFIDAVGAGLRKGAARTAAWLDLWSQLHLSGRLQQLSGQAGSSPELVHEESVQSLADHNDLASDAEVTCISPTVQVESTAASSATEGAATTAPLLHISFLEAHYNALKKEQYSHAPRRLFGPTHEDTAVTIRRACQRLNLSVNMGSNTSQHIRQKLNTKRKLSVVVCELLVEIEGFGAQTAREEGQNGQRAKRAAWMNMLAKLHNLGILRQLFPGVPPQIEQSSPSHDLKDHEGTNEPHQREQSAPSGDLKGDEVTTEPPQPQQSASSDDLDGDEDGLDHAKVKLSELDDRTLHEAKDAKLEIYNYAASLGVLPEFHIRSRRHRPKPGVKTSGPKHIVQVQIRLDTLGIETSGIGRSLKSAETTAALRFKRKMEETQQSRSDTLADRPSQALHLLTTESALRFMEVYCKARPGTSFEVENEMHTVAGFSYNSARILIDGKLVGKPVAMQTKKDAEAVARLVVALDIVKNEPEMMQNFVEALRERTGKGLGAARPLPVNIATSTLRIMRETLAEARRLGLPDERPGLTADDHPLEDMKSQRGQPSRQERQSISERLLKDSENVPHTIKPGATQELLPISHYRSQIVDLVSGSVYSIIIGATGSGKTTQVPQVLLDDAINRGEGGFCDVICTQPRRLAASSIAKRVASERKEALQQSVGYHVRFDAKRPKLGGSITYCTTGILLEQLKHDEGSVMDTASHLVIDEVHERDLQVDFLMILLRRTCEARIRSGKPVPKIVLMSATLDENLFTKYFAHNRMGKDLPAPVLSVPGRTFPVQERYLGDVLFDINSSSDNEYARLMEADGSVTKDFLASELAFEQAADAARRPVIDWKREHTGQTDDDNRAAAEKKQEALVPLALVAATIGHICKSTTDGAILVFLPGLHEIIRTKDLLLQHEIFGLNFADEERFKICLLHSTVPSDEQSVVFDPTPRKCRKVILSTNIAETSITVPDIRYVVDTGKLREKRYDQLRRITSLQCTWESNSNAHQRAGRAGRVQAGHYYALFSRARRQAMAASGLPEILRSDLQDTCLTIKAQGFQGSIEAFLSQAIEPPSPKAVHLAIDNLKALGALTDTESITALGRVLSKLPVHPALGKMIVLGIIFRCLDPMLIMGSMDGERALFMRPLRSREQARQAHKRYNHERSDHLAFYTAFTELRRIRAEQGLGAFISYASQNFLHTSAFRSIDATAVQVQEVLRDAGVLPRTPENRDASPLYGGQFFNRNSTNAALVKCLLIAGLHPNIGVKQYEKSRALRTSSERSVLIHPSSQNFEKKKAPSTDSTMYTYSALARSLDNNTLFMRDSTAITPLMSMLFGGTLKTEDWKLLTMDEWLPFQIRAFSPQFATHLFLEFRKALDRMLHCAFRSLSDIKPEKSMANEPINELFATNLVRILDAGVDREIEIRVPESWSRRALNAAAES